MLTTVAEPPKAERSSAAPRPAYSTPRNSAACANVVANIQTNNGNDQSTARARRFNMPESAQPTDDSNQPQPQEAVSEKDLVQVFKLLADETRLKILLSLQREGELHVSALCDRLDQSQPAVSHHLALLRDAGLIRPRRDGKHNYYSVRREHFERVIGGLFDSMLDPSTPA